MINLSEDYKRKHKAVCRVCGKLFYKGNKRIGNNAHRGVGVRGSNCVTCSPKCSKDNARRLIKRKKKK